MNILINASNVRFGGGITLAKNIIKSLQSSGKIDVIYILAPKEVGYEEFESERVKISYVENSFHHNYLNKFYTNNFVFPKIARKLRVDKVFSLGNVAFPSKVPHIVLLQNAYFFYPESEIWNRLSFKELVKTKLLRAYGLFHLRFANVFVTQTEVIKKRLSEQRNISEEKIHVMPNVVSYHSSALQLSKVKLPNANEIKLLFLSKFYVHKNFIILLPLAKLIRKSKRNIKIDLSLFVEENADTRALYKSICDNGMGDIIRFIGNISHEYINETLSKYDGLFLPSLLESYSGSYLEAMQAQISIFTSDMDFAHAVCKDAAFYFNPSDANSIFETIVEAFDNNLEIKDKIYRGNEILKDLPKWQDLDDMIYTAIIGAEN
jgi:glycosyltransferase involved in cell wall biosynthesis